MPNIKYSPLHSLHLKNKAKFIEFGGWTMPFSYKGTIKEHQFVRQNSGYFDVSHMGRLLIDNEYLQKVSSLICSDLLGLKSGKALYSLFTNEKGSALDDVIFWKYDDYVLLICNAANTGKITNYLQTEDILYQDLTEQTALIAVQGPEAISNLEALLTIPDSFSCLRNDIYTYARTGYTGEDGLEIMVNVEDLDELISLLVHNEIEPCGLGARDTLRLEAALPLYGFELTEDISPVEAGLKWTLTNKSKYKGSDVIDEQIRTGNHKVLKKFVIDSRNIARTGTKVKAANVNGLVTSGNFSPILQKSIGFVLLESQPDTDLLVLEIRGKFIEGKILKKRFLS